MSPGSPPGRRCGRPTRAGTRTAAEHLEGELALVALTGAHAEGQWHDATATKEVQFAAEGGGAGAARRGGLTQHPSPLADAEL